VLAGVSQLAFRVQPLVADCRRKLELEL
jgi:hypothetical protein